MTVWSGHPLILTRRSFDEHARSAGIRAGGFRLISAMMKTTWWKSPSCFRHWQAEALESVAHQQGLTAGELIRHLLLDYLTRKSGPLNERTFQFPRRHSLQHDAGVMKEFQSPIDPALVVSFLLMQPQATRPRRQGVKGAWTIAQMEPCRRNRELPVRRAPRRPHAETFVTRLPSSTDGRPSARISRN